MPFEAAGRSWWAGERWQFDLRFRWVRIGEDAFRSNIGGTVISRQFPAGQEAAGHARIDRWLRPARVWFDLRLSSRRLLLAAAFDAPRLCRLWLMDTATGEWDIVELAMKETELGRDLGRMVADDW